MKRTGRITAEPRHVEGGTISEYRVAYVKATGEWDVVETFAAVDNADANAYAEQHYADHEWYVLDDQGLNVNGGK